MRIKATDSKGNILAVIDTATAKLLIERCTVCSSICDASRILNTATGPACRSCFFHLCPVDAVRA